MIHTSGRSFVFWRHAFMLQIVVVLWAVLLIQEDQCQLLLGILIIGLLWVVIIHNKHTHLGYLYIQTFLNHLYLALNFANSSSYWRNSKHCHNSRLYTLMCTFIKSSDEAFYMFYFLYFTGLLALRAIPVDFYVSSLAFASQFSPVAASHRWMSTL